MANMKLTIQHENVIYEPPIQDGVKLEWERTGVPGKLTFTVLKTSGLSFTEGDVVRFYYDNKNVFCGYVFKKKFDREHNIEVTCYDQLRYLKNKYTYVFENKKASQIVKSLCNDFKLQTGTISDTKYVISAIAEENKSAFDIMLDALEDTLLNNGNMFVLYDDFGKIQLKNVTNMISNTLIMKDTAENFDYESSIDDETYNEIVLYYKQDDEIQQIYTASSPSRIKQWGKLRYFEEVKNHTIGQNKANSLLKLYNKKTRTLKVNGAFGDITIRGGTLIPVKLDLGDTTVNNYMLVEQVTHTFEKDNYIMDLKLEGAWEDGYVKDMVSKTIGEIKKPKPTPKPTSTSANPITNKPTITTPNKPTITTPNKPTITTPKPEDNRTEITVSIEDHTKDDCKTISERFKLDVLYGTIEYVALNPVSYYSEYEKKTITFKDYSALFTGCPKGGTVIIKITPAANHGVEIISAENISGGNFNITSSTGTIIAKHYTANNVTNDIKIKLKWVE